MYVFICIIEDTSLRFSNDFVLFCLISFVGPHLASS